MSKKVRYLLFILVLMVPLVLAACGGDDDKDKDKGGDDSVSLSQSFESPSGVSFKYPEGWAVAEEEGQVLLANSAEALAAMQAEGSSDSAPAAGQAGMVVMALPLAAMGLPEGTTIDTLLDMMVGSLTGEGMEVVGDKATIKIGDNDARKLNVKDSDSGSDGFIVAFMDGSDSFVMLIGVTAPGERDKFDDIGVKIAESIAYTAPAG